MCIEFLIEDYKKNHAHKGLRMMLPRGNKKLTESVIFAYFIRTSVTLSKDSGK